MIVFSMIYFQISIIGNVNIDVIFAHIKFAKQYFCSLMLVFNNLVWKRVGKQQQLVRTFNQKAFFEAFTLSTKIPQTAQKSNFEDEWVTLASLLQIAGSVE